MVRLQRLRSRIASAPSRVAPLKKVAKSIYNDPRWKALMVKIIAKRGRKCEDCGRTGCRIFGDHVIELNDGGEPFDEDNVRLRCGSCHGIKTAAAKRARLGLDGGGVV
jgi:5-methylcytosine-specific restriction protein A